VNPIPNPDPNPNQVPQMSLKRCSLDKSVFITEVRRVKARTSFVRPCGQRQRRHRMTRPTSSAHRSCARGQRPAARPCARSLCRARSRCSPRLRSRPLAPRRRSPRTAAPSGQCDRPPRARGAANTGRQRSAGGSSSWRMRLPPSRRSRRSSTRAWRRARYSGPSLSSRSSPATS
jgi:hypothetical protein